MASVHNPDQFMWNLRQIISQGRKKVGFLIGAGCPAGVRLIGADPLIPAIATLTKEVLAGLPEEYAPAVAGVIKDLGKELPNIEEILSRVRTTAAIIGEHKIHSLDGAGYKCLGKEICKGIGAIVAKNLPPGQNPYTEIVSWISGADRRAPIEIFTTNYDLLFEQAFERAHQPYFDGFVGGSTSFFDASTVANNDLPSRWARLWKLHGSLGWELTENDEVTRIARSEAPYCVFPEHLKYEQTRKAPYSALFDRFRSFLLEPDVLLIACGFSFADFHITSHIMECLVANPAASVFAFQYKALDDEPHAKNLALHRANVSIYARDKAVINTIVAPWRTGEPPTKNWKPIQETFWKPPAGDEAGQFLLGDFGKFAPFFAGARADAATTNSGSEITTPLSDTSAQEEKQKA